MLDSTYGFYNFEELIITGCPSNAIDGLLLNTPLYEQESVIDTQITSGIRKYVSYIIITKSRSEI